MIPKPEPTIGIYPIDSAFVDEVWDRAAPLLQLAIDKGHGEYGIEHVYDWLKKEAMHLCIIMINDRIVAAVCTEVIDHPLKRSFRASLLGGEGLKEWFDDWYAFFVVGARSVNADLLELYGRPGWDRFIRQRIDGVTTKIVMLQEV